MVDQTCKAYVPSTTDQGRHAKDAKDEINRQSVDVVWKECKITAKHKDAV